MKKILVAIDFSEVSQNAAIYAIEFAKTVGASVTFFHVFHIPVVTAEVTVIPDLEMLEKDSEDALRFFESEVRRVYPNNLAIDCVVNAGFVVDELTMYVEENNIDLVIMGITGAGRLEEVVIGSNATRAMESVDCPVMIIPRKTMFAPIKNIAFACDYKNKNHSLPLPKVKSFVKLTDARLNIINVVEENEQPDINKAITGIDIESYFEELSPKLFFPAVNRTSIAEEINAFIQSHNIDVLVMVPRKHNILKRLIHESTTKKLAFQTHIPLLTIHD